MRNKNLLPLSSNLTVETGTGKGTVSADMAFSVLKRWEKRYSKKFPETYVTLALQEILREHGKEIEVSRSRWQKFLSRKSEPEIVRQALIKVGDNYPSQQLYVVATDLPEHDSQIAVYPVYAPGIDERGQVIVPGHLDGRVQKYVIFESRNSTQSYHEGRLVDTNSRRIESLLSGWLTGARTC